MFVWHQKLSRIFCIKYLFSFISESTSKMLIKTAPRRNTHAEIFVLYVAWGLSSRKVSSVGEIFRMRSLATKIFMSRDLTSLLAEKQKWQRVQDGARCPAYLLWTYCRIFRMKTDWKRLQLTNDGGTVFFIHLYGAKLSSNWDFRRGTGRDF